MYSCNAFINVSNMIYIFIHSVGHFLRSCRDSLLQMSDKGLEQTVIVNLGNFNSGTGARLKSLWVCLRLCRFLYIAEKEELKLLKSLERKFGELLPSSVNFVWTSTVLCRYLERHPGRAILLVHDIVGDKHESGSCCQVEPVSWPVIPTPWLSWWWTDCL